jgi:hypothetical protein
MSLLQVAMEIAVAISIAMEIAAARFPSQFKGKFLINGSGTRGPATTFHVNHLNNDQVCEFLLR